MANPVVHVEFQCSDADNEWAYGLIAAEDETG